MNDSAPASTPRTNDLPARALLTLTTVLATFTAAAASAQLPREPASDLPPHREIHQFAELGDGAVVSKRIELKEIPIDTNPLGLEDAIHQGDFGPETGAASQRAPVEQSARRPTVLPTGTDLNLDTLDTPDGGMGSTEIAFDSISSANTGSIPPDTTIAVGPAQVMVAVNRGFSIYSKLGNLERPFTALSDFFATVIPTGSQVGLFDPRLIWSEEHERYVLFAVAKNDDDMEAYGFLAVSETTDPHGAWSTHRIELPGEHVDDAWWDYASLGVDAEGIYLTGNLFLWAGGFKEAIVFIFNNNVFSGGSLGGYSYSDNLSWPDGSQARGLQVAHPHTVNSDDETFFVNTRRTTGDDVLMWTLVRSGGSLFLTRAEIETSDYEGIYGNVNQPDTTVDIDGGDARALNVVYANRRLYATWTSDPVGNGNQSGAFLLHLNTDTETNLWDATKWFSSRYDFYPAITVEGGNTNGPAYVFLSTATPSTQYASSVMRAYPNWGTSTGTLSSTTREGLGHYDRLDSSSRNRWGDYSAATWDFDCRMAWGASEFAASSTNDNVWGTRVSAHQGSGSPDCSIVDVINPEGDDLTAGQTVTIDWDSFNVSAPGFWEVLLFIDGGFPIFLETGIPLATTSYTWEVGNYDSDDVRIVVNFRDGFDLVASGSSQVLNTVTGLPDYEVVGYDFPSALIADGTAPMSFRVTNSGPVDAPGVGVEIRLSTNGFCSGSDTLVTTYNTSPLPAGATQTNFIEPNIPDLFSNDYFLCIMPNASGSITEYDQDNNVAIPVYVGDDVLFSDSFAHSNTNDWSSSSR